MTVDRTYLDYNASAPLRAEARAAMLAALDRVGNASSVHREGRQVRAAIETARLAVADLVGARAADVVFTSGASEANATVLAGGWDTIYLSALEHDSVRVAAGHSGARVVEVAVTKAGVFDCEAFAEHLKKCPGKPARGLLCLQLANNETGVIQPVAAAAAIARAAGLRTHCDAVQAPGRVAVDVGALGVDYLALSAHKLGGPKGTGGVVCVDGAPLPTLIVGGGQERGRRAGTENVAAIVGFGVAAALARDDLAAVAALETLRDELEAGVHARTPGAVLIGGDAPRLANTSCLAMPGLANETMVIRLDLAGVAVSAGAACSSGKVGHSAVLAAMGLPAEVARAAVRVSLGHGTTRREVQVFLDAWASIAAAERRAA